MSVRLALATAAAYLLLAELGHFLALGEHAFPPFWPASGLYVGALLATHPRWWPWIVVAALAGSLFSSSAVHGIGLDLASRFAAAHMLEGLAAALLVRRFVSARLRFASVRESGGFVLWAVLVAPAMGATLAAWIDAGPDQAFGGAWPDWWASAALSQLMIAPLFLSLLVWRETGARVSGRGLEIAAITLSVLAALLLFFQNPLPIPVPYLTLPPMLWATLRMGLGGGMLTLFAVSVAILLGTGRGLGIYAQLPLTQAPFLIQTTLAAYGLTVLAVSSLYRERELAELEVRRAKDRLEERVHRRTLELEASEQVYRNLFELSPDGIFVHREGRIMYANAALLRLLRAERPEQVLGRTPLELIVPEDHEHAKVLQVPDQEAPMPPVEQRWRRIDGSEVMVEVASARHDALEGPGVQVLVRDVTERKQVQHELEERESRLRLAVQAARMFAFEWRPAAGMVRRSEECESILGLPGGVDDPVERFFAGVLEEDRPRLRALIGALSPANDRYTTLYRFRRPDGAVLQLEETARAGFDAGGMSRLVGMTVDVTAREEALTRLRESEARFAGVASAVGATLFTTLPTGECSYVNESFLGFSGLSRETALGFGWTRVVHPGDRARIESGWRQALKSGVPFLTEFRFRRFDGAYRWFQADCRPMKGDDGAVRQWVGIALDVEDQKRAQELLEQADRRKDEFLAMLAHELRTPLAPIRTAVDILGRHSGSSPQLERTGEILRRQVEHMARLVDDLLDVSRVTHGKIQLSLRVLELEPALRSGIELARPGIDAKRQLLEADLPAERRHVRADPTRLAQILGNLLGNAAKYSPVGGVLRLTAKVEEGQARIRVSDKGAGIPAELLPHVFDLFTQGERTLDRSQGGLGLGLALVKALVELHGGSVHAWSPGPGRGATFEVRLPLVEAPVDPPARVRAPESASKRVLLVEDNHDAAEMLAMLLRLQGYGLEVVHDGAAAIDASLRFLPEVALLDLGLPILDGYEVARRLRADPATASCRLIALSGYGQPEDRARSRAAGFDLHLVKPVDLTLLCEAIEAEAGLEP